MEFVTIGARKYNRNIVLNAKVLVYRYTELLCTIITSNMSIFISSSSNNPLYDISGDFIKISHNDRLCMLVNRKYINDIVYFHPIHNETTIGFSKPCAGGKMQIDVDIPIDVIIDALTRQLEADCLEELEEPLSHVKKDIQSFLIDN